MKLSDFIIAVLFCAPPAPGERLAAAPVRVGAEAAFGVSGPGEHRVVVCQDMLIELVSYDH